MKIAIYSRTKIVHEPRKLQTLLNALDKHQATVWCNTDFAAQVQALTRTRLPAEYSYHDASDFPKEIDLLISYGGDGTFLDSVRLLDNRPIPILGINVGHLGFLSNVAPSEIETAIENLFASRYRIEERILLQAEGSELQKCDYPFAFNEFTIQKQGVNMIDVEAYIDDELIATYRGDGLLLSTPSGSTAYSLSAGGPIVSPTSKCFVICPIAPHNLTMRPLIVPDSSRLHLKLNSRGCDCLMTLDTRNFTIPDGAIFNVKKSQKPVFLVHLQNISFYETLRNKMMWGVDTRDFSPANTARAESSGTPR